MPIVPLLEAMPLRCHTCLNAHIIVNEILHRQTGNTIVLEQSRQWWFTFAAFVATNARPIYYSNYPFPLIQSASKRSKSYRLMTLQLMLQTIGVRNESPAQSAGLSVFGRVTERQTYPPTTHPQRQKSERQPFRRRSTHHSA